MAGALALLGTERALLVSSEDGLDELSISAPTHVVEVDGERDRALRRRRPEDVGLRRAPRPRTVPGGTPERERRDDARDPRRRAPARRATSRCSTPAPRSTPPARRLARGGRARRRGGDRRRRAPPRRSSASCASDPASSRARVNALDRDRRRAPAARRARAPARREVPAARARAPRRRGAATGRARSRDALRAPGLSLIAEHKRRSPSAGRDPRRASTSTRSSCAPTSAAARRRCRSSPRRPHFGGIARRPARGARGRARCRSCARTSSSILPGARVAGRRRRRDPADRGRARRRDELARAARRGARARPRRARRGPRPRRARGRARASAPTSSASTTAT